ncbi:MAG TPA: addiction module protein [Bacteroidota bacterium]|jgi:hypothetical protein|nr:addiction module protein [Bacteroidota bacterium]
MTAKQIEKQLLKLDARSRAKLAERLISSLDDLSEAENEQLWAEEALRRHEELVNGKARSRPARDVFRSARAHLE